MSEQHIGECMCGSVQFQFHGTPRFVGECVCRSCRVAHGASVVGWVGVATTQFEILRGGSMLQWFNSSKESERGFCPSCGTRLFFRSTKWPGETHMALACMSEPHSFISTGVSFKDELPAWSVVHLDGD